MQDKFEDLTCSDTKYDGTKWLDAVFTHLPQMPGFGVIAIGKPRSLFFFKWATQGVFTQGKNTCSQYREEKRKFSLVTNKDIEMVFIEMRLILPIKDLYKISFSLMHWLHVNLLLLNILSFNDCMSINNP